MCDLTVGRLLKRLLVEYAMMQFLTLGHDPERNKYTPEYKSTQIIISFHWII